MLNICESFMTSDSSLKKNIGNLNENINNFYYDYDDNWYSNARNTISVVGSSTVYPFATVVAERMSNNGFKAPVVESTGTGGGMKIFCAGIGMNTPDFTNASRAIKQKEKDLCHKNGVQKSMR